MASSLIDLELALKAPRNVDAILKRTQAILDRAGLSVRIDVGNIKEAQSSLDATRRVVAAMGGAGSRLTKDFKTAVQVVNETERNLRRPVNLMQDLGRQTAITTKRFGVFIALNSLMRGTAQNLQDATADAVKFNSELRKVAQLLSNTRNSFGVGALGELRTTINGLSTDLGLSSIELAQSAKFFAQAGRSITEVNGLLKQLAPAGLTATFGDLEKSAESIEALLGQFKLSVGQVTPVLDVLNSVTKEYNVSIDELFKGLQKSGSTFASLSGIIDRGFGDERNLQNFREFVSLFTAIISTSRESADVVGTSLRTILPRLQRQRTQEALGGIGVSVVDNGRFVGVAEAITRISLALQSVDKSSPAFTALVEQLGGLRQFNRVIPLLTQGDKIRGALNIAESSQGSVAKDVALAQEDLAVQLAKLRQEFLLLVREFSQTGTFDNLTDSFITLTRGIIKLADALSFLAPFIPILGGIAAVRGFGSFATGFRRNFTTQIGGYASGGRVGGVDVALTPGELIFPPKAVSKIPGGYNTLYRANRTGNVSGLNNEGATVVPGRGNTDSVYTKVPPGSFILRKSASKKLLGYNKGGVAGYADGGFVPGPRIQGLQITNVLTKVGEELVKFGNTSKQVNRLLADIVTRFGTTNQAGAANAAIAQVQLAAAASVASNVPSKQIRGGGVRGGGNLGDLLVLAGVGTGKKLVGDVPFEFPAGKRLSPAANRPAASRPLVGTGSVEPIETFNFRSTIVSIEDLYDSAIKLGTSINAVTAAMNNADLASKAATQRALSPSVQQKLARRRASGGGTGRFPFKQEDIADILESSSGVPLGRKPNVFIPPGGIPIDVATRRNGFGRGALNLGKRALSIGNKFGGLLGGVGGIGLAIGGGVLQQSQNSTVRGIGGALSGAGVGASLGIAFGPLGAAIGGVSGAVVGAIGSFSKLREEIAKTEFDSLNEELKKLNELGGGNIDVVLNKSTGAFKQVDALIADLSNTQLRDKFFEPTRVLSNILPSSVGNFFGLGDRTNTINKRELDPIVGASQGLIDALEQQVTGEVQKAAFTGGGTGDLFSRLSSNEGLVRTLAIRSGRFRENSEAFSSNPQLLRSLGLTELRHLIERLSIPAQKSAQSLQLLIANMDGWNSMISRSNRALENLAFQGEQSAALVDNAFSGGGGVLTPIQNIFGNLQGRSLQEAFDTVANFNDRAFGGAANGSFDALGQGALAATFLKGGGAERALADFFRLQQATNPERLGSLTIGDALQEVFDKENFGGVVGAQLSNAIQDAGIEQTLLTEGFLGGELSDTLGKIGDQFSGATDVFKSAIDSFNQAQAKLLSDLGRLSDARIERDRGIIRGNQTRDQAFSFLLDNTGRGLSGVPALELARAQKTRDIGTLLGGTALQANDVEGIANTILGLRRQEGGTVGDIAQRGEAIKRLTAALEENTDQTEVLSVVQSRLADIQQTRENARNLIGNLASGDPAAIRDFNRTLRDINTIFSGGRLTSERFNAATSTFNQVSGALTEEDIRQLFGFGNREQLQNAFTRILGDRVSGFTSGGLDRDFIGEIIQNSLRGNPEENAVAQQGADILRFQAQAIDQQVRVQDESIKRQVQIIQQANQTFTESLSAVFNSAVPSFNQLSNSLNNFTQTFANGIQAKIEQQVRQDFSVRVIGIERSPDFEKVIRDIVTRELSQPKPRVPDEDVN